MTTLEVVEAVQRSLENEGFLQSIRAQLRSNVLRIISSGPDYSPRLGRSVALTQSKHGQIAIQLIKDLMEEYDLRESLTVFGAEVDLDNQAYFSRTSLQSELKITSSVQNGSLLESMIRDALTVTEEKSQAIVPSRPNVSSGDVEDAASVSEEEEGVDDDENVEYSQIEEIDDYDNLSANNSATVSPARTMGVAHDDAAPLSTRSPVMQAAPSLHSLHHLDESSSFEADSPIRDPASTGTAQQKFVSAMLDHSVAEELEEDLSVEEEDGAEVDADGGREGPEYEESDLSDGERPDHTEPTSNSAAKDDSKRSDSEDGSDLVKDSKGTNSPSHARSSLRPATAHDFDPTDRSATEHRFPVSNNRNRVSVHRAAADQAESKSSAESAPGSKANVLRLGQTSISRSQLGWGSEANSGALADHSGDEDSFHNTDKDSKVSSSGRGASGGLARYSATSQMEAVSFDSEEDEHQPSPVRGKNLRSSNQESESDASSSRSGDFDVEEEEGDVSFGDDDDVLPSVGRDAPTRSAFTASTIKPEENRVESYGDEDGEEEYEDDDFVEEEEEAEPARRPVPLPSVSLFNSRGSGDLAGGRAALKDEYSDEESVEEEIEGQDDMSVGDADSDEESSGFGSPAVAMNKKTKPSTVVTNTSSMFRAGRSGALPGVSGATKASNFDTALNSSEADSDSEQDGGVSDYLPSSTRATTAASQSHPATSITTRMREIDSQLEELEHSNPHLANLRGQSDDENSVASEDIDAMEFSTGGGPENDSESSGEGSFSFLDSSKK